VSLDAGLAVALSVVMHVGWNLMARHQPREAAPLWWVLLAHLVLLAPWGLYALFREVSWTPRLVALVATSATANAVYFLGLARAYRHAPVALVYPLVRSSPLLIAAWSTLLLHEALAPGAWLGIGVSVAGLGLMAASGRGGEDGRALPWALLAMVGTSVYSLSDRAATAYVPTFAALVGYISFGYAASWLALTVDLFRATGRWRPRARLSPAAFVAGGLCVGLAYALVIHAMRVMAPAVAVAYSNAGIVLASLASILVFKERTAWAARLAAAATICAGLLVMAA
jgi:phosphonate utilization associated putative membrane protein